MGQTFQPRSDAERRSADHRRQPVCRQPWPGARSIDRRRDLGGGGAAPDDGSDVNHPDRKELLAAAQWLHRCRIQLHPIERRRAAQSELGHRLPPARFADAADRIADPDQEGRRNGSGRSLVGGDVLPEISVAALVHPGRGPVRVEREPRARAAVAGSRGHRSPPGQQQSRANGASAPGWRSTTSGAWMSNRPRTSKHS